MKDEIGKNTDLESKQLKERDGKNILVVEDEFVSSQLICKILNKYFNTEAVETGEECLMRITDKEYSMVFMDINLGRGVSGLDVVKKIRNFEKYKNIPIIATTAFAMPGDKEEFLDAGCSGYLSKPFTKEKLLNILKEYNPDIIPK
jgi:CheY-like chemotaxis protein